MKTWPALAAVKPLAQMSAAVQVVVALSHTLAALMRFQQQLSRAVITMLVMSLRTAPRSNCIALHHMDIMCIAIRSCYLRQQHALLSTRSGVES